MCQDTVVNAIINNQEHAIWQYVKNQMVCVQLSDFAQEATEKGKKTESCEKWNQRQ